MGASVPTTNPASFVHPLNEPLPMEVTFVGDATLNVTSSMHPLKHSSGTPDRPVAEMSTKGTALHPLNAPVPRLFKVDGNTMEFCAIQPLNALLPIEVNLEPLKSMLYRTLHPLNAESPMIVRDWLKLNA